MDQNSQDNVLINNSRTTCQKLNLMPFLSFLDGQFTIRFAYTGVDNFEIEHKACQFLVRGAVPLKSIKYGISNSCIILNIILLEFEKQNGLLTMVIIYHQSPVN